MQQGENLIFFGILLTIIAPCDKIIMFGGLWAAFSEVGLPTSVFSIGEIFPFRTDTIS